MPVRVPTVQTGLEASIEAAAKKAGRNLKINLGANAKSVEGLSQPLGRITGKADQFTKSMEAANARVLAFGASVGVLSAVTRGFKELVTTTIEVEKALTNINSILNTSVGALNNFKKEIFDVARNTEQSFETVAQAALELSRQGLTAEQVVTRLNDAMVLSRLSGLGASEAVAGMTAAINSFNKSGVTSEQVLNKLSAASVKAAVSERDLIEGLKRSASVANQAGVSLDELIGVITAVQQKTARGGSVIGNSFKTIFTRIQSIDKLQTMQNLGVQITDVSGEVLSGTKLIENLANTIRDLPEARKLQIAENLVGKFQIAPFLAILDDYNSKTSIALKITEEAKNATSEAYNRNIALNKTLSASINEATINLKELANTLGEIGVTDSLKNILGFFNTLVTNIKDVMEGEGLGSDFARGIVKGLSNVLSGPGLAIFGAIIAKLTIDLVKFGTISLQTFFGLNKTAKDQAAIQGQIASTLLGNKTIQDQILKIENSTLSIEQKRAAQTKFFTVALNEQLAVMTRMQNIAGRVAPGVLAGTRGGGRRAAGGFVPNFDAVRGYGQERMDIAKGVGGAPSSARPVAIPNFNFGGGQKGTMIANTSEVVVPNYKGGGSAVFNQEMLGSVGAPSGGRAIRGAQGYIPNFAAPALKLNQVIRDLSSSGRLEATRRTGTSEFVIPGFKDKKVYQATINKALASGNVNSPKTGNLSIDASKYGIAAMFASKKTDQTFTSIDQLIPKTADAQAKSLAVSLKKRGVSKITFSGIQIRDLENDFKTGLKKKNPLSPTKNKNIIADLFANSLAQYGHKLVGSVFSNDEAQKISEQVGKLSKTSGGANLFSSAVEGGIFESAIRLVTKGAKGIKEFKSHTTEQEPFDFEEGGPASKKFMDTWQFTGVGKLGFRADAKRTATNEAVQTIIGKALRGDSAYIDSEASRKGFPKVAKGRGGKRGASGYIPNFAVSPLDMAIERERGAGVPINQIRINQDAGLRNSGNPMGLAVTNARDEPTGAIPNFAKIAVGPPIAPPGAKASPAASLAPEAKVVKAGFSDAMGKVLLFSTAIQMLSGVMGGVAGDSSVVAKSMKLLNIAVIALTASTMFGFGGGKGGMIGGIGRGISGVAGTFKGKGRMVAAGRLMRMKGSNMQMAGGVQRAIGSSRGLRGVGMVGKGFGRTLAGGAMKAGGALLRLAGPIGLAAAAALALKKGWDSWSGANDLLEKQTRMLADSSKRAAKELGDLQVPAEFKKGFTEDAEQRASDSVEQMKGQRAWFGNIVAGGKDKEILGNLEKSIANTLKEGVDSGSVNRLLMQMEMGTMGEMTFAGKTIKSAARERGSVGDDKLDPMKDIAPLLDRLALLREGVDMQKAVNQITTGMSSDQLDTAKQIISDQTKADSEGVDLTDEQKTRKRDFQDSFKKEFQKRKLNVEVANEAVLERVRGGFGDNTPEARMAQIQANLAKIRLKNALDLFAAKQKMIGSDEKALAIAQASGGFHREELTMMKAGIDMKKVDEATAIKVAGLMKKEIDGIEKLSLEKEKEVALEEILGGLTVEKLQQEGVREGIMIRLNELGGKSEKEGKKLVENLEAQVEGAENLGKQQKLNIKEAAKFRAEQEKIQRILERRLALRQQSRERKEFSTNLGLEESQSSIGRDIRRIQNNPNLGPVAQARQVAQKQFDQREVGIKIEEGRAVGQFRGELEQLTKQFRFLEGDLKGIDAILEKDGIEGFKKALEELDKVLKKDRFSILGFGFGGKIGEGDAGTKLKDAIGKMGDSVKGFFSKRKESGLDLVLDKENANLADGFKSLSQLLADFGRTLQQTAEQLRFDFAFARTGEGMVSNIRNRFETGERIRQGDTLSGNAFATGQGAIQEKKDQRFLARSSAERRTITKEIPILEKQFAIQQEIAALDEKGLLTEGKLIDAKKQLLALEKQRLEVNDSLSAKLENAFVFTQKEIDNKLTTDLTSAATAFTDRISDGLVDAIAKGKDLGETLRIAAADFFLDMAKANMKAAMGNITSGIGGFFGAANSGGMITGGSGTRDDIPTMLTGGEFVMRRGAVSRYGPDFMEALNRGSIQTMQRGGLFTPGTYGQGAITGKNNLLDFATQSHTMGQFDQTSSGSNFASVSLEPQSGALTMWGRRNSPMFAREQRSKEQAFGLYKSQYEHEKELEERKKQQKKDLRGAIMGAVIAGGLNYATGGFGKKAPTPNPNQVGTLAALPVDLSELFGGELNNIFSRNAQWYGGGQGVLPPKPAGWAAGGAVPYAAGVDTVPAMLSGGEFVMNPAATDRMGRGNLASLNSGGGNSEEVVGRLDELIDVSENRGESTINITVNSDGSSDQDGGGDQDQQSLAVRIRDVVRQVIEDEQRLGGSLRQVRA